MINPSVRMSLLNLQSMSLIHPQCPSYCSTTAKPTILIPKTSFQHLGHSSGFIYAHPFIGNKGRQGAICKAWGAKKQSDESPVRSVEKEKEAEKSVDAKEEEEEYVEEEVELTWVQEKAEDLVEFTGTVAQAIPGPRVGKTSMPWLVALPLAYMGFSFVIAVIKTIRKFNSPTAKKSRLVNKNAILHNFFILRFHRHPFKPISSSYCSKSKTPKPISSSYSPISKALKTPIPKSTAPKSATPKSTTPYAKSNLYDSSAFLDTQDWSFLTQNSSWSNENMTSVVAAAQLEQNSKVVVCMGTEQVVDYICSASPSIALSVLHYSLMELANIKEKHDDVRCRQGDIVGMPSSWGTLDVVFINYLSALICPLPEMFQTLVKRCAPGARVIISDAQGRAQLNANKQSHPDVITGDLPDKVELEKLLQGHPLQLVSFRDEPDFYFAVLKIS